MKDAHCSPLQRMMIHKVYYGNFSNNVGIFNVNAISNAQCTAVTSCKMKILCDGYRACEQTIDSTLLLPHICSNARRELYTQYTCVDNYIKPTITTGIVHNFFAI